MDKIINVELIKQPWNWFVVAFALVTLSALTHVAMNWSPKNADA